MNRNLLPMIAFMMAAFVHNPVWADQPKAKAVEKGTAHYLVFCANCHGVDADGKGPLAALLKVVPADLTALEKTSAGESLSERVLKAVDGRHEVLGDGQRKMPLFSENLEIRTVIEITEYLKSVQK